MKARSLTPCILLSILVILLLSTAAQATEYREVKAEEILKHIENGEEVNYTNCRIVGELNVSKIRLETVPNPNFNKLVERGYTKKILSSYGLKENLSVIESDITIKKSSFENGLYFSNVLFKNSASFSEATFNNSAYFNGVTFNNFAYFYKATFNDSAYFNVATFNNFAYFYKATFNNDAHFYRAKLNSSKFYEATFNNSAYFNGAEFNNPANFYNATFNNDAYFNGATFNNSTYFNRATFNNYTSFYHATFNNDAYFHNAKLNSSEFIEATFNNSTSFNGATFNNLASFHNVTFNNSTYFYHATFKNDAYFRVPDTSENIITDGTNCQIFMKGYNELARYTDADNIYYNFRKNSQDNKKSKDISKWTDTLSWITCGYGTKLPYTLCWTGIFIIVFAIIYRNPFDWKKPGIYRSSEATSENKSRVSFLECLYFSSNTFTRLGSADWHARDNFRKWVTLEGLLGWITLALVMATLMRLFIRS